MGNWKDHILNFLSVILGVSLAFYVNNWAEENKEKDELKLIKVSFIEDLKEDIATYEEYQIPFNENQSNVISSVLKQLSTGQISDSLQLQLQEALAINNYRPIGVTFNSISTSGKLGLISDFNLRNNLLRYYEIIAKESEIRGNTQVEFFMNHIMPWMVENNNLSQPDIRQLTQNQVFINQLILYQGFVNNKNLSYKELATSARELISNLE